MIGCWNLQPGSRSFFRVPFSVLDDTAPQANLAVVENPDLPARDSGVRLGHADFAAPLRPGLGLSVQQEAGGRKRGKQISSQFAARESHNSKVRCLWSYL